MMHVPSPSIRSRFHYVTRIFLILILTCLDVFYFYYNWFQQNQACLLSTGVLGSVECLWNKSRSTNGSDADPPSVASMMPYFFSSLICKHTADTEKLQRRKVSDSLRRFGEQAVVSPSDPAHLSDYSPPLQHDWKLRLLPHGL